MPVRFERFLNELTETEIAVEQVSTLAQIEHLKTTRFSKTLAICSLTMKFSSTTTKT